LQSTIADNEDDAEGLAKAYELFGKSGDKVFKAVKDGSLNFEELSGTATDAAGSVSDTFEETLDPIDQWQLTLNELKLAGAELGATIGQVLAPALQAVAGFISDLRAKWEELSPAQQEMIVQIAGIVAVIGPVVAIIGSIVSGIGGLITSMTAIAAVFGTTIGVVAGVAAGIAALIAVIVLLILNWDKVKAKVKEVWEKVSEYVGNLKENVKAKFEEMKQAVQDRIAQIKQDAQDKWNQIKQDAIDKVVGMKNDIVNKLAELKSKVVEKLNDIKSKFTEKFNDIKDKVKGVIDDIKGFFEGLKLKIPKPELPDLPHFKLTGKFSLNPLEVPKLSVDWYAKAMGTPYLFTQPTIMQTPYGNIGAGEAGAEIMYGRDNLMRDIAAAQASNNSALEQGVYNAMVAALQTGDFTIQIGNREFGRILREAGAL
jgi:phage-related minor tail protein